MLTLALLALAFAAFTGRGARVHVLKLHTAFLIPFLVLRRRWRALGGFLLGSSAILLATAATTGVTSLRDYVGSQLPRISRFGEVGTPAMRLPSDVIADAHRGLPRGYTRKGGRAYYESRLNFVYNATIVRPLHQYIAERGGGAGLTTVSVCVFAGLFLPVALLLWPACARLHDWAKADVLLSGPLTWATNTVWLLPSSVVILERYRTMRLSTEGLWLAVAALGFLFVGAPDYQAFSALDGFGDAGNRVLEWKYVIGTALLLVGFAALIRIGRRRGTGGSLRNAIQEPGAAETGM